MRVYPCDSSKRDDFFFLEVLRHRDREADVDARLAGRGGALRGIGDRCFRRVSRRTGLPQFRQCSVAARANSSFR